MVTFVCCRLRCYEQTLLHSCSSMQLWLSLDNPYVYSYICMLRPSYSANKDTARPGQVAFEVRGGNKSVVSPGGEAIPPLDRRYKGPHTEGFDISTRGKNCLSVFYVSFFTQACFCCCKVAELKSQNAALLCVRQGRASGLGWAVAEHSKDTLLKVVVLE